MPRTTRRSNANDYDWSLLDRIILAKGGHNCPEEGMCALEAYTRITGSMFSDAPPDVAASIAAFFRHWNDDLGEAERNVLIKPLLPLLVGTRTNEPDEDTRALMAMDWLVREYTPPWLRIAGLAREADTLDSLPPIKDAKTANEAKLALNDAETAASAITTALQDGLIYPDIDATRDKTWCAAWAAISSVVNVRTMAHPAWAAASEASWAAAIIAGNNTMPKTVIAPTAVKLHRSAQDLVRRMCAVGRSNTGTPPKEA